MRPRRRRIPLSEQLLEQEQQQAAAALASEQQQQAAAAPASSQHQQTPAERPPASPRLSLPPPELTLYNIDPSTPSTSTGIQHTEESTSESSDTDLSQTTIEELSALSTPTPTPTPTRHRVAFKFPATNPVSFSEYISNCTETARKSQNFSETQCEKINAEAKKLKESTEALKRKIYGFSRSLKEINTQPHQRTPNNNKLNTNNNRNLESTPGDIAFGWLTLDLSASELENYNNYPTNTSNFSTSDLDSTSNSNTPPPQVNNNTMTENYLKVAKIASQLVPLFAGGQSTNTSLELRTFLGCCKNALQCLNQEEKRAFNAIFQTRLRGEAFQLITSRQPATFEDAEAILKQTYLPRETYPELVHRLTNCKQYPYESLNTYITRIKDLLDMCKQAADSMYGDNAAAVKLQLEDFAKGTIKSGVISKSLCTFLLTLRTETLEEVIQQALEMERLQQTALHIQNPLYTYPIYNQDTTSQPNAAIPHPNGSSTYGQLQYTHQPIFKNHNYLPQELPVPTPPVVPEKVQPQKTRQERSERYLENITCNFCYKKGHTYSDCMKRKNTPYCIKCKTTGHDVRTCRKNNYNNNNYSNNNNNNRNNNGYQQNRNQPQVGPRNPQNRSQQENGPRVYNISKTCDFCGRRGHLISDCFQKRKWESKSSGNSQPSNQKSPARR